MVPPILSDQLRALGARLRSERERLGFDHAEFSALVGAHQVKDKATDVQEFAERVRTAALELNLNATSLGGKLGLASSTAANYWKGVRPWPTEVLIPLADLLGVDLRWLLSGEALPSRASAKSQGNYERGDRAVDVAYLLGLAQHGVDVGYVVTGIRSRSVAQIEHQRFLRMFGDLSTRERAAVLAFVTVLCGEEEAR